MDTSVAARAIDDVDLAVVNNNYAGQVGLTASENGVFVEDKDSPYVNIIVARADNKDSKAIQDFVKAYQTDEVEAEAKKSNLKMVLSKAGNLTDLTIKNPPTVGGFLLNHQSHTLTLSILNCITLINFAHWCCRYKLPIINIGTTSGVLRFKRLGNFRWHIIFVMLCKHFTSNKHAIL